MTDTSTSEGRAKRIDEIINDHASKSKRKGDAHYRAAMQWGAPADYSEADAGEPPKGAEWD
jgi:hypothetical protein